ncbi:MAG: TetR/AcrR family transcriptional regulator [Fimbriimonadaceae bacterium]
MPTRTESSTRDVILDAMDGLMARYGFRKTTVEDVAKAARVSRRTIYTYFASKEELGLASIERVANTAQAHMRQELATTGDIGHRLRQMLTARIMVRVEVVAAYHVSLDELFGAVRSEYLVRRSTFVERERALLVSAIEEGVAKGQFDVRNPQSVASSLLLATDAFLPYGLSIAELGSPTTIRARLDAMIDLLVRGVRAEKA